SFIRTVRSSPTGLNQRRQPPERRINPPEVGIMSVTGSVIAPARTSLWSALNGAGPLSDRALWGVEASVSLGDLVDGSALEGRLEELRDRSVLVATGDQLTAALALIELDGVASRLVLCPPDLPAEHLPYVVATAAVDAQVTDEAVPGAAAPGVEALVTCSPKITPGGCDRTPRHATEWILLTSGTTGRPKMVVHTLASLAGAITGGGTPAAPAVWTTFYDIRRYGGLQIFLRALLGGGSMVLSSAGEWTGDFLVRAVTDATAQRCGARYYFAGRRGGIINVGGLKVHPEEVEAVINAHPRVRMSLVRTRKNPITGALVVADVVLNAEADVANGRALELEQEIMRRCREVLP